MQQDNSVLVANTNKLQANAIKDFLRRYSAISGVLNQADFSLSLNEPRYRKVKSWWQSLLNLPNRFANKSQKISAPYVDQNDMAVTKELLAKLAKEVQGKNRKFILAVFPNTINYAELTQQAKELKTLAATNNFGYMDLSKSFLACSDPSSNFIQYHFSKKGHAVVAYDLFNTIGNSLKQ